MGAGGEGETTENTFRVVFASDSSLPEGEDIIGKVGLVDGVGDDINPATEEKQDDIISAVGVSPGTPKYFEDTNFLTGESPVTLDINAELGRNSTKVLIINDGPGNFTYQLSIDGDAFGDSITLKSSEFKNYNNDVSVDSIKITWVSNSAYRVEAI